MDSRPVQTTVGSVSVYHLRSAPNTDPHGRCRLYSFHNSIGEWLLQTRFPEIPGDAIVYAPAEPNTPLLRLKAWRWFWWNGRYNVIDEASGKVIAILRRTGGIETPAGSSLGRVRNATRLRTHFLQAVLTGLLDALFNQGGTPATLSQDQFRIEIDGAEAGAIRRGKLTPIDAAEEASPQPAQGLKRWLQNVRVAIGNSAVSSGWILDFSKAPAEFDQRVLLAAALFRIHLEERYRS